MFGNIEELLKTGTSYGVKSVKFTEGDPGVYPGFFDLMDVIAVWRERHPSIEKWGMCTNGGAVSQAGEVRGPGCIATG